MKTIRTLLLLIICLSFINGFVSPEGEPCIYGPFNVSPNTVIPYVILVDDTIFSVTNNGANASIHSYHNDTLNIFTGPIPGLFSINLLDAVGGNVLCSLQVRVDKALPVELYSFTSDVSRNNVLLNWTTQSEENNSGFTVQRKEESSQWTEVGFIPGNGTTVHANNYSFNDVNLNSGKYKYRLKQIDYNGNFQYYDLHNEVGIGIPSKFSLSQNYPNPFNPVTIINYEIASQSIVTIKIFDVNGKEINRIENGFKEPGYHSVSFDASSVPSGIYFYKLEVGNFSAVRRMMLVK